MVAVLTYQFRIATSGDRRAARHAGRIDAANATAATMAVEYTKGAGPMAPSWKTRPR